MVKMGNGGMKKERESDVASKSPYDVLGKELYLHRQQLLNADEISSITSSLKAEESKLV